jgi:hypothetical protein
MHSGHELKNTQERCTPVLAFCTRFVLVVDFFDGGGLMLLGIQSGTHIHNQGHLVYGSMRSVLIMYGQGVPLV